MQLNFINTVLSLQIDQGNLSTSEAETEANRLLQILREQQSWLLTQFISVQPDGLIASEAYNALIKSIAADLNNAFSESDNLTALLSSYQRLCRDKMINELRQIIAKLEQERFVIDSLSRNSNGFDSVANISFQHIANRTFRNASSDSLLYQDVRQGKMLTVDQECYIDTLGQCLLPPLTDLTIHKLMKADLVSMELPNQLVSLDVPGSDLKNIIDDQTNTIWALREVATHADTAGLQAELSFDNGNYTDFSYIDIKPFSNFPLSIDSLAYENTQQQRQDIDLSGNSLTRQAITGPIRIHFPTCRGRHLLLKLKQTSSRLLSASALEQASANELPSLPLPEILTPTNPVLYIQDDIYAEYKLGLDEIKTGTITCAPLGIYVAPVVQVAKCSIIGLEANLEDCGRYAAAEFYVLKKDYGKNGTLLQSNIYPILPLNQTSIIGEEAIFLETVGNNIAKISSLRYRAHNQSTPNLQVFENNRQMAATEFSFPDDFSTATQTRIYVHTLNSNSRYTVDYTPIHLNGLSPVYLDDNQSAWLMNNNIIYCAKTFNHIAITNSTLYLMIYFRLDTAQQDIVPRLLSCRLLTGSYKEV